MCRVSMSHDMLFDCGDDAEGQPEREVSGDVRLRRANREQSIMWACAIDELIPADHRARAFWELLDTFDLSSFLEGIRSRGQHGGRPAIDPQVLICLWLYATSEGVGSARHLSRLVDRDAPYRWIAGGMSVSAHTLSDFRVGHQKALDKLLTDLLAMLMSSGVVSLDRIAQDGTRVRANAGAASFRRERSIKECLRVAKKQVEAALAELEAPASVDTEKVKKVAAARAAQGRTERLQKALTELEELRGGSQKQKDPEEVRASSTDPDARVMKQADGGYRPAYNIQGVVDTKSRIIVDVAVTKKGNDYEEMEPMLDRVQDRLGEQPHELLVDGGYAKKSCIEAVEGRGVGVYAPQAKTRKGDPAKPRWDDEEGVARWRRRMATPEAAEVYKERASTIETAFGDMKQHRGLRQLPVRGVEKAYSIALLTTLAYNFVRVISLGVTT